ncbi:hypothetical protein [Hymenobacter algoricola]|uniref:Uncharacterized protein n=1 Tax=Hymenobacter algoricola TaxID=486267 RepID=A0ABP7NUW7_9BACT
MAYLKHHVGPPPVPPPPYPGFPEPSVFLLAGNTTSVGITGPGTATMQGAPVLPLGTMADGKKCWIFDAATQLAVTGHGLAAVNSVSFLAGFSMPAQVGQHYLIALEDGSNAGQGRFDAYSDGGQLNWRRQRDDTSISATTGYMGNPGQPSYYGISQAFGAGGKLICYSTTFGEDPLIYDTPQTVSNNIDGILYLMAGGAGFFIPMEAGTQLRYFLVWPTAITAAKMKAWKAWLDYQP